MVSKGKARQIAGECVDPVNAADNKIARFAATGEIEPGLLGAVFAAKAYAEDYVPSEAAALKDLHEYVKAHEGGRS